MSLLLVRARIGHLVTRLQQYGDKTDGTVWTRTAGRSYIATPVDVFRGTEAATLSLDGIVAALEAADIPHRIVSAPPERSRVVVADIQEAVSVIGRGPDAWYETVEGKTAHLRGAPGRKAQDPSVLFRAWATPDGTFLAGSDAGVELTTHAPDKATAPDFPIDAVFTWVDGSDPLWRQRKHARAAGQLTGLHETAANDARYASFDELRYALRSIDMYAPWIRHIFLVTDQQVPQWLDTASPRVTIVDHRDIFDDPEALPTFNSHAIEACLHHIPGLGEHWIYFNDDVFLARVLPPSFFFDPDGRPRVFLAEDEIAPGPPVPTDPPVVTAAKNNRDLLRDLTGYDLRHKLKHVAHPQLRSLGAELEDLAPEGFQRTGRSPFRSPRDLSVASSLLPHFALATERGVHGSMDHFYVDVASPELKWRLPLLREMRGGDVLCFNATGSTMLGPDDVHRFLLDLFPVTAGSEVFGA